MRNSLRVTRGLSSDNLTRRDTIERRISAANHNPMQTLDHETGKQAFVAEENIESETLLDKFIARVITDKRKLAIFYGVCNLSNFLIGAGILALTTVFTTSGWLVGSILFGIFAMTTWFSLDLLLDAAHATDTLSYEALGFAIGGWTVQMVRKEIHFYHVMSD
jgi:hypothetical protein